jgi:hypothetical protein
MGSVVIGVLGSMLTMGIGSVGIAMTSGWILWGVVVVVGSVWVMTGAGVASVEWGGMESAMDEVIKFGKGLPREKVEKVLYGFIGY